MCVFEESAAPFKIGKKTLFIIERERGVHYVCERDRESGKKSVAP